MSRFLRGLTIGTAASLLALSCASPGDPPSVAVKPATPSPVARTEQAAVSLGLAPVSVGKDGVPQILRAFRPLPAPVGATVAEAAKHHVATVRPLYGKGTPETEIAAVQELTEGAAIVAIKQRVKGVEIFGAPVRMLLNKDKALTAVSGSLVSPRLADGPTKSFRQTAGSAVATALQDQFGVAVAGNAFSDGRKSGDFQHLIAPPRTDLAVSESRAKRVYYKTDQGLVAAWEVEFFARHDLSQDDRAYRYIVADRDGSVLLRDNLTDSETFIYRVWADPSGERRPQDGPHRSVAPHPTGFPDGTGLTYVAPSLVAIDGFNVPRDPWLPTGATRTFGNNVFAYGDRTGPPDTAAPQANEPPAPISAPGVFDYTYDVNLSPLANDTQLRAAVVQLFYVNNWLHDWYYDSFFTEEAGNAQVGNYGRGGEEQDPIFAQAQDDALGNGSRSNANMSTPGDGIPPRMQMFVFSGKVHEASVGVPSLGLFLDAGTASFGPPNFEVTGELIIAEDGTAPSGSDGCQALTNTVTGKIVLVDRGTCDFKSKARNVANAGGAAMVLVDNRPAPVPPGMGNSATVPGLIPIPSLSLLQADGVRIKTAVAAGPVTATIRESSGTELDGDFDTAIVAHEWGHYLHRRLVVCNNAQCDAMSEGWGDFVALHLMLRANDNPDGTYGMGSYATSADPNSTYWGIRRYAYSTDRTKNNLSFRHIMDGVPLPTDVPHSSLAGVNSEIHAAGEIWTSMLWDAYRAVLRNRPYADARRRMSDYVVAGLMMTPANATYTEARDAILTAVAQIGPSDLRAVAQAFAGRGAGTCAVSPGRDSVDFTGLVEDFGLKGTLVAGELSMSTDTTSCDPDGYLDPGETGTLHLEVANKGADAIFDVTIQASSTNTELTFGDAIEIATLAPFEVRQVEIPVTVSRTGTPQSTALISVELNATGGCSAEPLTRTLRQPIGLDEVSGSREDHVDAQSTTWTLAGDGATELWGISTDENDNRVWFGINAGEPSDTQLVSPALQVSATGSFTFTMQHRWILEDTYDGGVIELTTDGGTTWRDVTELGVDPHYTGPLVATGDNPIRGRNAFSGQNPSFPARETLTLDFADRLAGQTVQIRFRLGADLNTAEAGWEIDDIVVTGIDNAPFIVVGPETGTCDAPQVNAGPDQVVDTGSSVTLAGTATDPNGDTLTLTWTQIGGPGVTLTGANTLAPTFTAPAASAELVFRLAATDGTSTASDTVTVRVRGANTAPTVNAGADRSVAIGAAVELLASATDAEGDDVTFAWTQDSGPAVTLAGANTRLATFTAPTVTADTPLVFTVTATDDRGATATDSVTITVTKANAAPVVDAGPDQTVASAAAVTLAGTATDADGDTLTYAWTQLEGPRVTLTGGTTLAPTFTAPATTADLTLIFKLAVNDGRTTSTDVVTVNVLRANTAPTVSAGPDQTVESGATVSLAGAATDAEGNRLSVVWTQTQGTAVTLANPFTLTPTFTAPTPTNDEPLVFRITATDGRASATDEVTVLVRRANHAPVASAGADQSVTGGASVTLAGSATDEDGDTLTYAWSQISGAAVTLSGADTATATFTAPAADSTLGFRLTVSDGRATSTDDVVVTVGRANTAPTVNAGADQTVDGGAAVTLDGSATDAEGDPLTYAWTQTGGPDVTLTGSNAEDASFTAPTVTAETVLTFRLTVGDGRTSTTDDVQVTVRAPLPPDAGTPDAGETPDAGTPDAGTPDAGTPDASPPRPDAGPPPPDDDDGCGCRSTSPSGAANLLLPLAAIGFAVRRRRRR